MPVTYSVPPTGNFLGDGVHSDSRSCQILSAVAAENQHAKTVTSVFHLHNNRSRREVNVHMNGQRLKHDAHPVYLGVTLDRSLSYREHSSHSAAKLNSWSSLIAKVADSSWRANASTVYTSALVLCNSVAEYCCPAWARYSYTNLIDTQLHSSKQVSWLQVLGSVAPPSLHHKVATDNMLQITDAHTN